MSDTRVVLIVGPRQSGRTTLAKKIANEVPPTFPAASDPWNRLTPVYSELTGVLEYLGKRLARLITLQPPRHQTASRSQLAAKAMYSEITTTHAWWICPPTAMLLRRKTVLMTHKQINH